MGAKANLAVKTEAVGFGLDSVVIAHYVGGIEGGRSLDVADFPDDVIHAGHIVIRSTEDETLFKPMPVSGEAYAALPEGFEYVGVVRSSILKEAPLAAIMNSGRVNDAAMHYPITPAIKTALQAAVPTLIVFHD